MHATSGKFRFLFVAALILVCASGLWNIRQRSLTNITGYVDPEYAYLMNSLAVSTGRPTGHWDHPGLTQQILGGFFLRTLERNSTTQIQNVLKNPEHYIVFLEYCTLLISTFLLVLSWWYFYRGTRDVMATALFIFGPLTHPEYFTQVGRLAPDFLMLALSSYLLALVIPLWRASDRADTLNTYQTILIAVFVTLTALTKITSLFLLAFVCMIAGQMFFRRQSQLQGRHWAFAMLSALSVLVACIYLSVGGLYKMFIAYFYNWISNVATHQDNYGSGAMGFYNLSRLPLNIVDSVRSAPFVYVALLFGITTTVSRKAHPKHWRVDVLPLIIFVFLHVLTTLKAPQGRYLWPITPLAALLFYAPSRSTERVHDWLRYILGSCIILSVVLAFCSAIWSGYEARQIRIDNNRTSAEIIGASKTFGCTTLVDSGNQLPSLPAALFFGNNFSHRNFATELEAIYPNYFNLDSNGRAYDFYRYDKAEQLQNQIRNQRNQIDTTNKYCVVATENNNQITMGRFILTKLYTYGTGLSLYQIQ